MRKFIGITAAAALLAGAGLVTGVANPSHAFASTGCTATSNTSQDCLSTVTISANNTPYQLSNVSFSTFSPVTLDGVNHPTTSTAPNTGTVLDASGTGTGWNVTLQATPFRHSNGDVIAAPNITTSPAGAAPAGTGATRGLPAGANGGPIDAGAVKVLSAAAQAGMGQYSVTFSPLTANIPANVYAGTYSTTITVTLIGGTP